MLQGLPDFSQAIFGENFVAYAPYEGIGNITAIPLQLKIANNPDGKPAFALEAIRSSSPFGSPQPHGIIDFRLALGELELSCLEKVRTKWHQSPIARPYFSQGFVRFYLKDGEFSTKTSDLQVPETLEGLGISQIRLVRQISLESLTLIKQGIQGQIVLMEACAELELKGVVPPLAATIEFNPFDLTKNLEKIADAERRVSVLKLQDYLKNNLNTLPISFRQKGADFTPVGFATTMADWITHHFSQFVPAPDDLLEPHIKLFTADEAGKGKFTWDLSKPLVASRIFVFKFDPLVQARELVKSKGINALYKETVVQPFNTGVVRLLVTHELPKAPENVASFGVKLNAPSSSQRPQAINKTLTFSASENKYFAEMRFSPSEKLQYKYTPFVVTRDSRGTKELLGPTMTATEERLKLESDDFPVEFISVEATKPLLNIANLQCLFEWQENEKPIASNSIKLTPDKPSTSLALVKGGFENLKCTVEARDKASLTVVKTIATNFENLYLDLFAFAEYGPHYVDIHCVFGDQEMVYVLELLPEGKDPVAKNITLLSFTPKEPLRSWQWYADSIFQPGFRYRSYKTSNKPQDGWSVIQSPFIGKLDIDLTQPSIEPMPEVPKLEGDRDFESIRYFQNPSDDHSFYFIPLHPGPQNDGQGNLTLSLISTAGINMFQIGVHWKEESSILEQLRKKIATEYKNITPALLRLSFAPIKVEKVDLLLMNGEEEQIIGTSSSSESYPYSAIFSVKLTNEQKDRVVAAIHNQENTLQARYYASRQVDVTAQYTLQGDIRNAKKDLNASNATLESCREWLVDAIDLGKLSVDKSASELASNKLQEQTETAAIELGAAQILQFIQTGKIQPDAAKFSLAVEKTETIQLPFYVITDVGTWFSGNEGDEYIRIL